MTEAREELVQIARLLAAKRLTHGSTGNVSVRADHGILVTPTGVALDRVRADELSLIDDEGRHVGGPQPTKEAFLHAAVLRARADARAVVHTHSTYSAALSCLRDLNPRDALPPLTAYFVMRVGRLRALPYFAPGDDRLGPAAERAAATEHALLLRNHGPIVAGRSLSEAADALEEVEETARLFFILRGSATSPLDSEQRRALESVPPAP